MKPTTTPFPAILTNSATHLHGEYAALSSKDKKALLEFLVQEKRKWLEAIGADFDALAHDYQRPPQLANGGKPWTTWLILGGRGSGKTRAGAQWVRGLALNDPSARIALIGETKHDAREVMVEGVSGLLAVHRTDERPQWLPTRQRLEWRNGAVAQVFSAEEPEGLRGPQFSAAWLDELAKWRHANEAALINSWRSPRDPLDNYAAFMGFET
jgi:phage terminase large subunit-like protein